MEYPKNPFRPGAPPSDASGRVAGMPQSPQRRSFFGALIAVGAAFVTALLAVPLAVYAVDPLFKRTTRKAWSSAGPATDFDSISKPAEPVISVERLDGWRLVASRKPVYVLPPGVGKHRVLSPVCPHLGCEVGWVEDRKQFFCPCHDSSFAEDGSVISGPSPRAMDYLESRVANGQLMVKYEYFRLLVPDREVMG